MFFDVVLVVKEVEIPAHRILLAGCSPYFYAMFSNFKERKLDRIEMKKIDPFALELLINYVYTAEILITEDNVEVITTLRSFTVARTIQIIIIMVTKLTYLLQTLLVTANLLQFSVVSDLCCEFLMNQLHPGNCLSIHEFADQNGCLNLSKVTTSYIASHFSLVLFEIT